MSNGVDSGSTRTGSSAVVWYCSMALKNHTRTLFRYTIICICHLLNVTVDHKPGLFSTCTKHYRRSSDIQLDRRPHIKSSLRATILQVLVVSRVQIATRRVVRPVGSILGGRWWWTSWGGTTNDCHAVFIFFRRAII